MKIHVCIMALTLLNFLVNAENLLINPSFENTQSGGNVHLPSNWSLFPKNNNFSKLDSKDAIAGCNSADITIPAGKEGTFLFNQSRKVKIPANTRIKLSGWFKSEKYRTVKGKKSARGIYLNVMFVDGTKGYPTLSFYPTGGKWEYKEQFFTYPKDIVAINYVYLKHYNASGTVKFDDLYFGPFTKDDESAQTKALVVIPRTEKAPLIDGRLDDKCWTNAARLGNFVLFGKKEAFAANQTEVYMTYDSSNLYIATRAFARVLDPVNQETTKFKANCTVKDSSVFHDDSVEIFIAPDKKKYYHLAYNSLATAYDAEGLKKEWNMQWEVKTSVNNKAWLAEVCIPWAALGIKPGEKQSFEFNFGRNERADQETSSWNPAENSFHDPGSFAVGVLGSRTVQINAENLIAGSMPLGTRPVELNFSGTNSFALDANLNVLQNKGYEFFHKNVNIVSGKNTVATIDMSLKKAGDYAYNYSVIDKNTSSLLFRSPLYNVKAVLVEPARIELDFKGRMTVSVNGKILDSDKFFLTEGSNDLSINCSGDGILSGRIILPNGLGDQADIIRINAGVKGNAVIKRQILLNSTTIKTVWTGDGLHVLRDTSQHVPIKVKNPEDKILELLVPDSLSMIGPSKDGEKLNYNGFAVLIKVTAPQMIDGKKYKSYNFIFTGNPPKEYVLSSLYQVAPDTPENGLALYYRVKDANTVEVWNKLAIKAMPAIKGIRPENLKVHFWHGGHMGGYSNQAQADALYRSFGDLGFNAVTERNLTYGSERFYNAARKAGLNIFAEFSMSHSFRPLARKFPEYLILHDKKYNKAHNTILMQPTWFYGDGRGEVTKIIADYVKKYDFYAMQIDHEANPFDLDDSPASLKAFAEYAKLPKVPTKEEVNTKYRKQWIDFACWTWGRIAEVFREGIKQGNPNTLFSIYSCYQSPDLMGKYTCNWNDLKKSVDIAMMGYGRQSDKVRSDTLEALGKVPAYFGVSYWAGSPPGIGIQMKNMFIRRIVDGAAGITVYHWGRFEGISKTKIAEACTILAKYEPFFAGHERDENFSVSGDFIKDDVAILKHNAQRLIVVFNYSKNPRRGTVKLAGKTIKMTVPPNDVNVELVK